MLGLNPKSDKDFEAETLMNGRTFDPSMPVAPSLFEGTLSAVPMGLAQGIIAQPGQLIADAIDPPLASAGRKIDDIFGTDIEGFFKQDQQNARDMVKRLTPDPKTTGVGAQTLYSLSTILPQVAVGAVTGGTAGAVALPSALQGYSENVRLQQEGVDPTTAMEVGGITALTTAAGVLMPAALGTGLAAKALTGAALNTAIGIPSRYATSKTLEANGYAEMAQQFDPLDKTAIISDIVLGAGFGAVAHYFPHEATDAAIVARNNFHAEIETAPGIPTDTASRNAHNDAINAKMEELLTGERRDVSEFITPETSFIPDPEKTAGYDILKSAIDESGLGDIMRQNDEIEARLKQMGIAPDDGVKYSRGLRSTLAEATVNLKQAKGTGEQMLGILKNTPGVKEEEIAWTGLDEFLKGKQSVTKQEIADYLAQNKVQLEELTLRTPFDQSDENILAELQDRAPEQIGEQKPSDGPTKFNQYTLPGGENYREVLLTLPQNEVKVDGSNIVLSVESKAPNGNVRYKWSADGKDGIHIADASVPESEVKKQIAIKLKPSSLDVNFQSSHYDQPNILAHFRLNDRTDADGKKVLFVEEIQSDWHQAGRKKGYKSDEKLTSEGLPEKWKVKESKTTVGGKTFWEIEDESGSQVGYGDTREKAVSNAKGRMSGAWGGTKTGAVPDAPFKKTWHEMAFRRIMQEAAEKGYDRVAWTTGEQQAERYDLSKQVDTLVVGKKDGKYWFKARPVGSDELVIKEGLSANELSDNIGKDMADKSVKDIGEKDGQKAYYGTDLKVGGEGMRGFYDNILVKYADKFGKKLGAKVGKTKIGAEGKDIPDTLYDVVLPNGKVVEQVDSPKRAAAIARNFEGAVVREVDTRSSVHSIDITPQMREAAGKGFELFSRGDGKGSTVGDLENAVRQSFGEATDALLKAGKIKIVQSVKDLPVKHSEASGKIRGMTDEKGNVYLVADNVSPKDVRGLILHEVGVHAGMEKMLGKRIMDKVLTDLQQLEASGNARVLEARKLIPEDTKPEHMNEELLAYLVQNAPELPLVQRIISAIKNFIYKLTDGKLVNLTDRDMTQMAVAALKKHARDGGEATGEAKFAGDKTNTPAFKKWFGDSKVVDENGEPLTVYHGTSSNFNTFNIDSERTGEFGPGAYFTDSPKEASKYAPTNSKTGNAGQSVIPVYLSIKKPFLIKKDPSEFWDKFWNGSDAETIKNAKNAGYDGVIFQRQEREFVNGKFVDTENTVTHYVVYDQNQIKSVFNRGTFDANDPRILYSKEETKTPKAMEDQVLSDNPDISVVNDNGQPMRAEMALENADENIKESNKKKPLFEIAANCALRG